jgi:hypothetical protein
MVMTAVVIILLSLDLHEVLLASPLSSAIPLFPEVTAIQVILISIHLSILLLNDAFLGLLKVAVIGWYVLVHMHFLDVIFEFVLIEWLPVLQVLSLDVIEGPILPRHVLLLVIIVLLVVAVQVLFVLGQYGRSLGGGVLYLDEALVLGAGWVVVLWEETVEYELLLLLVATVNVVDLVLTHPAELNNCIHLLGSLLHLQDSAAAAQTLVHSQRRLLGQIPLLD